MTTCLITTKIKINEIVKLKLDEVSRHSFINIKTSNMLDNLQLTYSKFVINQKKKKRNNHHLDFSKTVPFLEIHIYIYMFRGKISIPFQMLLVIRNT